MSLYLLCMLDICKYLGIIFLRTWRLVGENGFLGFQSIRSFAKAIRLDKSWIGIIDQIKDVISHTNLSYWLDIHVDRGTSIVSTWCYWAIKWFDTPAIRVDIFCWTRSWKLRACLVRLSVKTNLNPKVAESSISWSQLNRRRWRTE